MKKSFAFILVTFVSFLLMVVSYLLPVLCTLPLWANVVCIAYQFIFYTMVLAFFVFLIVNKKSK